MRIGRLVTLEGGEGVGKSTLAAGLAAAIAATGLEVVRTREPGGSTGADQIRALLVTGAQDRWSALSETLLLAAARNDHLERVIRPAIARGAVVVCDRFTDSTVAYQVVGRGLPHERLAEINKLIDAPTPDVTIVLDLEPAAGRARIAARGDGDARYESFDADFHAKIREAFLVIAAHAPQRCIVIDAGRPPTEVLTEARAALAIRLGLAL
jgi:dTMP kinase